MKKFVMIGMGLLALIFGLTGCDTGTGPSGGDPFPIEGLYTFTVNNNTCRLEFKDDLTWDFTGYVASANKSGTYSVSENTVVMEYTAQGYTTVEDFTASSIGEDKISLKLNDGSKQVSVIFVNFALSTTELELAVDNSEPSEPLSVKGSYHTGDYQTRLLLPNGWFGLRDIWFTFTDDSVASETSILYPDPMYRSMVSTMNYSILGNIITITTPAGVSEQFTVSQSSVGNRIRITLMLNDDLATGSVVLSELIHKSDAINIMFYRGL
jgi:hypothetical protein